MKLFSLLLLTVYGDVEGGPKGLRIGGLIELGDWTNEVGS